MFMQRHTDEDNEGEVRPIRMAYSAYVHPFFRITNTSWDIDADNTDEYDGMFHIVFPLSVQLFSFSLCPVFHRPCYSFYLEFYRDLLSDRGGALWSVQ